MDNNTVKNTSSFKNQVDMHTHSENSHDSLCKMSDMILSQYKMGTKAYAVTDHFDAGYVDRFDYFNPICNSFNEAKKLNESNEYGIEVLAGVEISEGFWNPKHTKSIIEMYDFDVVIGSVHVVKHKDLDTPYAGIDFTKLDVDVIMAFLDSYFNDVITMLEVSDFDILAHLTCPLRYINGKYKLGVDISRFDEKIDDILKLALKRNLCLEVNTSSCRMMDEYMPSENIIKRYYDMGGRKISLASDAHVAEYASAYFDKAIPFLKNVGFESICLFRNRKAFEVEI